jgi:hypothetical protein
MKTKIELLNFEILEKLLALANKLFYLKLWNPGPRSTCGARVVGILTTNRRGVT